MRLVARKIVPLRETEPIFDQKGIGTRRFNEFIREVTAVTNENAAEISAAVSIEIFALVADINNRLGSGDALTSDSDSFTVDSDELFTDLTEA